MTDGKTIRVRSSDSPVGRPRGPLRRSIELLLYPAFQLLLLIPALRRWRRAAWWNRVRLAGGMAGLALTAAGGFSRWALPGGLLLILALSLGPAPDPDRWRKLAERLGAQHTLNGGIYAGGSLALRPGTPLRFFLSSTAIIVSPCERPDRPVARYPLSALDRLDLAGEAYRPRYVSFAKEPPRRELNPDRNAVCRLRLGLGADTLELDYHGVFARHLAETAAHTLHDLRRLSVAESAPAARLPVMG
jgi:hypothetical protein